MEVAISKAPLGDDVEGDFRLTISIERFVAHQIAAAIGQRWRGKPQNLVNFGHAFQKGCFSVSV